MRIRTAVMLLILLPAAAGGEESPSLSPATKTCLGCHESVTPGITADWRRSRHSAVTPRQAMLPPKLSRRFSAEKFAADVVPDSPVGCAECHTIYSNSHGDAFEHNGYRVHVVVTPEDCDACHPEERAQYAQNLMSRAHGNLTKNPAYKDLMAQASGSLTWVNTGLVFKEPDADSLASSCLSCHGTVVEKTGLVKRTTKIAGELEFPVLSGWPNQGVGRVNPDGSLGSCASCHPRHSFAIEIARKPHTCAQCHKGPDVPAYSVYQVSKHGNIFDSQGGGWNFTAVPWRAGKDFAAPTCAACHVSLLADGDEARVPRSHQMSDRLPWRLMGLFYAHPHPQQPDTSVIRNRAGLPLPTDLNSDPAGRFLIDAAEQEARRSRMISVCAACHASDWSAGFFNRLETAIKITNEMTISATGIMIKAWDEGAATWTERNGPFNEPLEREWVEQWLFYANSTRFSAAMSGADYGVFDNGRWYLNRNLDRMYEHLRQLPPRPENKKKE